MIALAVFFGILAVGGIAGLVIRAKIREFSRSVFGTERLSDGLNRSAQDAAMTPRSVSSMTRIMEPQIMRDFPDFSWPEFKVKAENLLTSALLAVSTGEERRLTDASEEIRKQIANRIAANKAAGIREVYRDVRIHQTEIANYRKEKGKCLITIQSALQSYHYKTQKDRVTEGSKEMPEQTKFNVELMYIQDAEAAESGNAVGTTCPHCGAPIKNLGAMHCEFCGLAVTPINIKVWSLHKIQEVDYKHV